MRDKPFRIATFNIHHAEGRDGVIDIERIADVVRGIEPDLVALQELDVGAPRSGLADQPSELSDLLGLHVHFAPAMDLSVGRYGVGLAAKEDLGATTVNLPRVGSEEPRVALVASWNSIAVVTTHLSRDAVARTRQTEELARITRGLGPPAIVLGDLNQSVPGLSPLIDTGMTPARPRRALADRFRRGRQIDHILVSEELSVRRAWTVPTIASDHAVLVAEIRRGT